MNIIIIIIYANKYNICGYSLSHENKNMVLHVYEDNFLETYFKFKKIFNCISNRLILLFK